LAQLAQHVKRPWQDKAVVVAKNNQQMPGKQEQEK
jgi:hypothetical protein